ARVEKPVHFDAEGFHPMTDYKVADLSLAPLGRKEIELAEIEMPGLMALRQQYGPTKPLTGARIAGSLHMTIQPAVLIETLVELGKAGQGPDTAESDSEEYACILAVLRRTLGETPGLWTGIANAIRGVSEETTTGVHRLYQRMEQGTLLFPAINVNDSVTKSK